ncbi:MAG: glycine zipper family protein, partial [Magnetococcales bacterium]|nr:glycine zipper family protein [Magnetococcales bacterium]
AAGAVVGAAVGLVSGKSVGSSTGKGVAAGAAAGALLGGIMAGTSNEANARILRDLNRKSLSAKAIEPGAFGYGLIFFPGEAKQARKLRLQLVELGSGQEKDKIYTLDLRLNPNGKK